MGAKNLVMIKSTYIDSINICFGNDFIYGNVLWALASLRVFFCNYVLYSLGLILRYIFRFQVEDRKSDRRVQPALADQTKRNQSEDSEIDGLAEDLANLLFPSSEYFHVAGEEREEEAECPVLVENSVSDFPGESKSGEKEEKETSVLMETYYDVHEDTTKIEGEEDYSISMEKCPDIHVDAMGSGGETEGSVLVESVPDGHQDVKKIGENETESSVFMEGDSNVHDDDRKRVEEIQEKEKEQVKGPFVMDSNSATTTSMFQFVSGKDISVFIEEPTTMTFSFRDFYADQNVTAVSHNAFTITENIANQEYLKLNSKEGHIAQEEEESVQEQKTSISVSYEEDHHLYNDNSLPSDSESESSSSNSLIWGNGNNIEQILSCNNSGEGFEPESLKVIKDERVEDVEGTQFLWDREVSHGLAGVNTEKEGSYHVEEAYEDSLGRTEETMWEERFDESDSDEEDEEDDDMEWEHDELVEQLKMELRNARQGGLATILEEEEEGKETESPKVVEDLKPLKIEQKLEYKDHIVEIQKVYNRYAEKMRKLDILNYQTMHAIGILQLKDPLKIFLMPKSTVQGAKPLISQNLWPRKAPKHTSDPMLKFVHELHRELELVYVGEVCLSWEILCWQHKKVLELKQYDSQWPRRYNLVAGEFQTFQVLMQRFIENEPFQGPRIQNYVKNRCVIRKLLQVPVVKDDNTKDKKIIKWGEEVAISSVMLAEIIKESMRLLWEFVRADKEYGNVNLEVSQQIGDDVKDPAISDLLVDIRSQLQKKERKLKDIVRSGNCIVRKFQKHNEDQIQLDHEQLLAQVGLRLISRVVNMKKLRKDQVLWCNEKLNRIKFVGKKIQVEPSFLLFPC